VLVPDADAWAGLLVAHCLAASGEVVLHGLSGRAATPFRRSKLFTTFEILGGGFELDRWLKRIDEIIAERSIDVVLPISGYAIRSLSERRSALTWAAKLVDLPDPHVFDIAANKAALAEFMNTHDLPHPTTVVVTTGAAANAPLSALSFPALAKPPISTAGEGIRVLRDRRELELFLAHQPPGECWVLQEFVEGYDVCVNVLCRNGEIIASNSQREIVPSSRRFGPTVGIDVTDDPLATDLAQRLMRKLGWSGVANIDMRFDERRKVPLALEVNGRYWGSLLASLNADVNFPLLACEASLGITSSNRKPQKTRYFYGSKRHLLLSLAGGGKHRIRPSETFLRYFVRDPVPFTLQLANKIAKQIRTRVLRIGAD
jgi:predicted ATP-grasp superfamily ATP-dependent carboligase